MYSFQANIGSRGYHVDKDIEWKLIYVNHLITVSKEINATSMEHDPYCCKVNIQRRDKKQNRFRYSRTYSIEVRFLFLKVGSAVSGTAVDGKHKVSLILGSGLEIPSLLNFTHHCKEILDKMEWFTEKQLPRSTEPFRFSEDTCSSSDKGIFTESDQNNEEK